MERKKEIDYGKLRGTRENNSTCTNIETYLSIKQAYSSHTLPPTRRDDYFRLKQVRS